MRCVQIYLIAHKGHNNNWYCNSNSFINENINTILLFEYFVHFVANLDKPDLEFYFYEYFAE